MKIVERINKIFGSADRRSVAGFAALTLAALAFRFYLAPQKGSEYDMGAFAYWAATGQHFNFLHFYWPGTWMKLSFPNYALFFPVLAFLGPAAQATTEAGRVFLKTPAIFGDIILAGIVYCCAKPRSRLAAAAFILFNPAVWFDSAVFGQVDCLHTVCMTLSVLAASDRKYRGAWMYLVAGMFFKVQAIAVLPLIAALHWRGSGFKKMAWELVPAAVLAAALALPFAIASSLSGIWNSMRSSVGLFPKVSINAWNPWFLLHMFSGRWISDAETFLGLSYRNLGLLALAIMIAAIIYVLPKRPSRPVVFAAAAAMCFSFFMLPTEMHERYLYPLLPFIAVIIGESWVVALVAVAVSIVIFMDMNYAQFWSSAISRYLQTVNDLVVWTLVSIALFVIFLVWFFRFVAREKQGLTEK